MWQNRRPLPKPPREQRDDDDGYEVPIRGMVDSPYDSMRSFDVSDNDRKIVVRKLPRSVSMETLQLYFESRRHLGRELEVKDVKLNEEQDRAVITFETVQDAKYVLERHQKIPCVLHKQTLQLEVMNEDIDTIDADDTRTESSQNYSDMYEKYDTREDDTDTIEVRGFSESCTDDTLRFYFENTNRSGGADITSFNIKREKGFVHITFENPSVVKRVTGRKHVVEKCQLSVHPFIISKRDLLLDEVPDAVTEEHLINFVEAKLKVTTTSVVFNQDRNKALVHFADGYDFRKAQKVLREHKINGEYLLPVQVPVSNCIIVYNIPDDVTHDGVEVYFENTKRSQGGDTANVELHSDEGYCLVFFKDFRVASRVCQKKDHKLHSRHVDVQPFNEYLGFPEGCEILSFKLPEPISLLDYNTYKIKFLQKNDKQRAALERELKKCHAEILWDEQPVVVECTLDKDDKFHKKLTGNWGKKAQDVVDQFTDVLEVRSMTVATAIWDAVLNELSTVSLSHPDGVALVVEKANQKIVLAAHKGLVDNTWESITEAIQTAERKEKERKETVTEEKSIDMWKINYLKAAGFDEEMRDEYAGLQISFEERHGKGKIIAIGSKQVVSNVLLAMYERLQNVRQRDVMIGRENAQLLHDKNTREKLQRKLKKQRLSDVIEIKPDGVVQLYADDDDDLSKMESAVNKSFAKLCFKLDPGMKTILQSDKWKSTRKALHDKFPGSLIFKEDSGELEIFTLADIRDHLSKELQSFLTKNAVYKEEMSMSSHTVKFFKHVQKSRFERDLNLLKGQGLNISITLDDKNGSVSLEGTSDGIQQGKQMIQKLESVIQKEQHTIKRRKVKSYMACSQGQECVKKVQNNTPCIIKVESAGFKKSVQGQQRPTMTTFDKPTHCAEATLKSGVKLTVVGGDITALDVDVLVNAANKELKHAGGLAAVILNKGGKEIQRECDNRIQKNGSLADGGVYMSTAGNLRCKAVAHAVGPHWKGGADGEEMCLQRAVFSCLEKAGKRQFKSIAMPALSAGMFHYPVDMACMAIVKAVDQHFGNNPSSVKEVFLCDISQSTVQAFSVAVQRVVRDTTVHVDLSQADGPKPAWLISTDDDKGLRNTASAEQVKVEVVKAELAREKVDVVVNSTSPDLQLKKGVSSDAILKAAGDKIQQECDQNNSNGVDVGEVAITSGGKMKCSNIFHIAIKRFDRDNSRGCLKGISRCVTSCMEEADNRGYKSISFPAMGTGGQRYPKDKVAKEMFKAVFNFLGDHPDSSLQIVRFVIYTQDDETFEAFVSEEKNWSSATRHQRQSSARRKYTKPGVGKLVKESGGKATFKFGSVSLEMYEGDITEEDAKAIVASCNLDMDLSKGAVTKALLKKGGKAIELDCKKQRGTMKKEGIAVTTAGNLRAKYIIHVDTKYNAWDWRPVIASCLRSAEKHNFSNIALPALGTSIGCKPEEIAEVMHAALDDFLKDKPSNLQEIRLVIFQREHVRGFINGMKTVTQGHPPDDKSRSSERRRLPSRQSTSSDHQQPRKQKTDDADDSCTITIYAESKEKLDKAIKSFDKTVKDEWLIKEINDESVHRLSSKNKDEIIKMAKNYHVELHIDTDVGKIEVIGLVANVVNVFDAIYKQLRSADNSFYLKDRAQLMSNIVRWFYLKGQKDYPFPDKVNLEIESAYRKKVKNVKVKDRSGGEYEIDFVNMEEHDVKQPNNKFSIIRRDFIAGANSVDIPKHWTTMPDKENLKLVTLNPSSQEYTKVLGEFKQTLGANPNIVRIDRIQNKTLHTQYSAKRKEMNVRYPNKKDNERVLWHGTAEDAVQSINSHGFNRSYCGKNATAIGEGVYFAVQSAYSNQSTYSPVGRDGNKRMYRCLVLTGKYTMGRGGMRVPPPIDQSQPHLLYDSVANNTSGPSMFVIFNDTQAYPEHIIVYK